jgi:hypothetical protein
MALQRRRHATASQSPLQIIVPFRKHPLGVVIEAQERQRFELVAFRACRIRVKLIETFKWRPGIHAGIAIWLAVCFTPFWLLIWPNEQAESLNETVVSRAAISRSKHVLGDPARLRWAEQRETGSLNRLTITMPPRHCAWSALRASGSLCNARAEAEFSIVGDRQGVVVVGRRNHRRDGAEDFHTRNAHWVVDVKE